MGTSKACWLVGTSFFNPIWVFLADSQGKLACSPRISLWLRYILCSSYHFAVEGLARAQWCSLSQIASVRFTSQSNAAALTSGLRRARTVAW